MNETTEAKATAHTDLGWRYTPAAWPSASIIAAPHRQR